MRRWKVGLGLGQGVGFGGFFRRWVGSGVLLTGLGGDIDDQADDRGDGGRNNPAQVHGLAGCQAQEGFECLGTPALGGDDR